MLSPAERQAKRLEYSKTEGFALFTDMNSRILNDLDGFTPAKTEFDMGYLHEYDTALPGLALFATMQEIGAPLKAISESSEITRRKNVEAKYGLGEQEFKKAEPYVYQDGLEDLYFPWAFSAVLANTVVQDFVQKKWIRQAEYEALSLGDWANVIGSGWFGDLSRSMSYTSLGTYNSIGDTIRGYKQGGFLEGLSKQDHDFDNVRGMFDIAEKVEPFEDNRSYLTASLTKGFKKILRERMGRTMGGATKGCPVARHKAVLPTEIAVENPNVRALIDRRVLSTDQDIDQCPAETVVVRQDETAIDRTLIHIASKLDAYNDRYGTPVYRREGDFFKPHHEFLAPTGALYKD